MGVNTFGYNGVIELRKEIVDKLLAQVETSNLVKRKGKVSNDEFVTIDLGTIGGRHVVVYLLIGTPTADFAPSAKQTNAIDLQVPARVAVFGGPTTGSSNWKIFRSPMIIGIENLVLAEAASGANSVLRPDFTNVKVEDIILARQGASGIKLDDATLDMLLTANGLNLKGKDLRAQMLTQLQAGALKGLDIKVPSAGLKLADVKSWDLRVLSKNKTKVGATYDSIALLLSETSTKGVGIPDDAGNTIPAGSNPPHTFGLQLRGDVLMGLIEDLLDRQGYYHQGVTSADKNTKSNPYGPLIVTSGAATIKYWLPPRPGGKATEITVSAPQSNTVTVTIPKGGLMPHSRGRLHNSLLNQSVNFEANGDGAASIAIGAEGGHLLGIEIYAVSLAGDSDAIVWRPKFTLHEGKLRATFHAYYIIDDWCDADLEGCWVDIALTTDRSAPFKVKPSVIGKNIPLPWWAHALGFIVEFVTGGIVNGIAASILVETVGSSMVSNFVAEKLDANLKKQMAFPTLGSDRLAMFLERIDVANDGIGFFGYADAGQVTDYGRVEITFDAKKPKGHADIGTGLEGVFVNVEPTASGDLRATSTWPVAANPSANADMTFWPADYNEGAAKTYANTVFTVTKGKPVTFWTAPLEASIKVLVEWLPDDKTVRITWVGFRTRVEPSISILDKIVAIQVSAANLTIAAHICYRYSGWIELAEQKFFRTAISRQAGLEKWTWNGQEIGPDASVWAAGAIFTWDTATDRITAEINQAKIAPPPGPPPAEGTIGMAVPQQVHTFEYTGEDVFGTKLKATKTIEAPACFTKSLDILLKRPGWRDRVGPGPWSDSWGIQDDLGLIEDPNDLIKSALADLITARIGGDPRISALADVLATALRDGEAQIDSSSARLLLELVGES